MTAAIPMPLSPTKEAYNDYYTLTDQGLFPTLLEPLSSITSGSDYLFNPLSSITDDFASIVSSLTDSPSSTHYDEAFFSQELIIPFTRTPTLTPSPSSTAFAIPSPASTNFTLSPPSPTSSKRSSASPQPQCAPAQAILGPIRSSPRSLPRSLPIHHQSSNPLHRHLSTPPLVPLRRAHPSQAALAPSSSHQTRSPSPPKRQPDPNVLTYIEILRSLDYLQDWIIKARRSDPALVDGFVSGGLGVVGELRERVRSRVVNMRYA